MNTRNEEDATGVAVAFVLGLLVGIGLAVPAFPPGTTLTVGGIDFGPTGAALFAAAVAVLLLPFGMFALYVLFAAGE